jgi:hypothetical protein
MVAREPSHDALSPERESAEAPACALRAGRKRRQSPGVFFVLVHRDHDEGNGWLTKGAVENPKGLEPPD